MVISGLAVFAILATAAALIGDFAPANLFDIEPTDAVGASSFLPLGFYGIWAALPFGMWLFLAVEGVPLAAEEAKPAPSWVQLSYLNNQLGLALDAAGQYDQALEYHQKSLAIYLKQLGPDHPDVATSYNNIGTLHYANGEYDHALEYYQKSLAIWLKQLGADHPKVATNYNNIGMVLRVKGEYDKALEYYQKSLAIKLKQLGMDHPKVANSYNNIAFVYEAKKDLPKAKEYWKKAYAIRLKRLGPNHPNTKIVKGQLDALK